MKKAMVLFLFLCAQCIFIAEAAEPGLTKPGPEDALRMLKDGNERFCTGEAVHPHADFARLQLAGKEDQGNHAYATVIACSDSRVPVELIFDAGVMDIFVIRVAGNVCDTDEIGSIEYGLAHVHTPVLVLLGHTQCGAVTAVTRALRGEGHALERNIPPLVDNIVPAVKRAMEEHQDVHGEGIIPHAIEENVWQGIEDLFLKSPAVRNLVHEGKAVVVGAVYDVATGRVEWLPLNKVHAILEKVEASPARETEPFAGHGGRTLTLSEALSRVEMFEALSDAQRDLLKSAVTLRRAKAGERIVEQDKPLDRMFILLGGGAEVWVNDQLVVTLSGQTVIGEVEYLDGRPGTSNVYLLEDTDLLELSYAALTDLMEQHPRLGYVLMREIAEIEARRLRDTNPN